MSGDASTTSASMTSTSAMTPGSPPVVAALLRAARPPFLLLTPACVLLGYATAVQALAPAAPETLRALVVLVGALAAHAAVNLLNEYHDFVSGLDTMTERTPFSGGSGALPECPRAAPAVRIAGWGLVALTIAIGVYLTLKVGLALLAFGLIGVAIVIAYTGKLTRRPALCLFAPGLGFGLTMVVGTHVALTGGVTALAVLAALVPTALTSNLLLLNQLPDVDADARVGRRHLAIAAGVDAAAIAYGLFAAFAAVVIAGLVASSLVPPGAGVALVPLALAAFAFRGARLHGKAIGRHPRYLAANVITALATPTLLALALIV